MGMNAPRSALSIAQMQEQRYELALTPTEALDTFSDAAVVDALYGGDLHAAGGALRGSVATQGTTLVLRAQRFRPFQLCMPLTASVEVDLHPAAWGSTFTLRRIPARLRGVAEFRRILIVGLLSVAAVAWVSPIAAAAVFAVQLVVVALVWLINRRGIRAVNDTLVSLIWTVWAPALRDDAPGVYRGLAAPAP